MDKCSVQISVVLKNLKINNRTLTLYHFIVKKAPLLNITTIMVTPLIKNVSPDLELSVISYPTTIPCTNIANLDLNYEGTS